MITAEEFVLEINDTEQSKNFKLATVIDLFENDTAKVQFDGEDIPSEKQYAYLESYTPEIFDRVLLAVTGGTYVILGKVNYNISPPTIEELDRYLFDQKLVTMTQSLSVTGGASIVGDIGVNGAITASGQLQGGSISTDGVLTAAGGGTLTGAFTFNNAPTFAQGITASASYWNIIPSIQVSTLQFPTSAGVINGPVTFQRAINSPDTSGWNTFRYLKAQSFSHTGTELGFFNKTTVARPNAGATYNVLSTSASLLDTINKLNTYINLLKNYGLAP